MIERQDGMTGKKWSDELGRPGRPWIACARDEDDGNAVAAELIRDGMPADLDRPASVDDGAGPEYIRRGSTTRGKSFTKVRES
jgi:hypothetical protein